MRLLVASLPDPASVNLRDRLLEAANWSPEGEYQGRPCYRLHDMLMVSVDQLHLHLDHVDRTVGLELGVRIEEVVFLSKHRAASGKPTLTMHPIGNFGRADYGGREGTLVPASPSFLGGLLRALSSSAKGLPFEVSYEVTHHGPFLEVPTTYVEIGSDETKWGNVDAAIAMAEALLNWTPAEGPTVGRHRRRPLRPAFTEETLGQESKVRPYGRQACAGRQIRTRKCWKSWRKRWSPLGPGPPMCTRKSFSRPEARRLSDLLLAAGYQVLEGGDLEDIQSLPRPSHRTAPRSRSSGRPSIRA